jgi:hypothetical protein
MDKMRGGKKEKGRRKGSEKEKRKNGRKIRGGKKKRGREKRKKKRRGEKGKNCRRGQFRLFTISI